MSRIVFVLASFAALAFVASPAFGQVAAPVQSSYLFTGLYNTTTNAFVAGFGSYNPYCQRRNNNTYISFFCSGTSRVQYTCTNSSCTNCTASPAIPNPDFTTGTVNTTSNVEIVYNQTIYCDTTPGNVFVQNFTSTVNDAVVAVYGDSSCTGSPPGTAAYYIAAPINQCTTILQRNFGQSPFVITNNTVAVFTNDDQTCGTANASQTIIPPINYYSTNSACVTTSAYSAIRLGFTAAATTQIAPTTQTFVTGTTNGAGVTSNSAATAAAATAAAATASAASTTGVASSTAVASTTASTNGVVSTTAVAASTTAVAASTTGVVSTTVSTTAVPTTGFSVSTTGVSVSTTGVRATTGRVTTGSSASALTIASITVVIAAAFAAFF